MDHPAAGKRGMKPVVPLQQVKIIYQFLTFRKPSNLNTDKKSFFCLKTDMYREAAEQEKFYNKGTKKQNPWKGENGYEVRIYYGYL